jgi:hypothetical protein
MTKYTVAYYFKKLIKDMPDELNTMKEINAYIKKALTEAQKAAEWDKTLERYFEIYFMDYKITSEKEQNDMRLRHTMNESLLSEEGILKYRRDIKKAVAKSEKSKKWADINRDDKRKKKEEVQVDDESEDVEKIFKEVIKVPKDERLKWLMNLRDVGVVEAFKLMKELERRTGKKFGGDIILVTSDDKEKKKEQTKTNEVNEDIGAKIRREAKQKHPNDPSAQLRHIIEKDGKRLRDTFGIHFG